MNVFYPQVVPNLTMPERNASRLARSLTSRSFAF